MALNCPACARPLTVLQVEGVEVDACHGGCGGLWFDNFELKRFDEPHESSAWEQTMVSVAAEVVVDHAAKRACPRCAALMQRHFFSAQRRAHVDTCPQCGGNWLDCGELAQIRAEFRAKANRAAAQVNKHLRWAVGD
jgi:Zn-finger nucleic acid-binding protein